METKTIVESSLGSYSIALQKAFEEGYVISEKSNHYPWVDLQFNAILEKNTSEKPRGRPAKR